MMHPDLSVGLAAKGVIVLCIKYAFLKHQQRNAAILKLGFCDPLQLSRLV
jgi:hypothetical protein